MNLRHAGATETHKKWRLTVGTVALSASLLTGLMSATSMAATIADPSDPAVQAAIQRTFDGTWSQADIDLIQSNPELAAKLPDPRRAPTTVIKQADLNEDGQPVDAANGQPLSPAEAADFEPSSTADSTLLDREVLPAETDSAQPTGIAPRITGGTWRKTHVIRTHYSYLGDVIYKYHHWAEFNYGGGKVRAWRYRADDTTNAVDWVEPRERQINQVTSANQTLSATSYMKRKMAHCVITNIACSYTYPWVKTKVYGNGSVTFTTGS
ncbi:hypothetical protein ACFWVF_32720 [Streptomyces sp. NPDC058659]|uniref:hypothetical protein n=1 Tax=unclassified Streptomyces TaxID=2593676 RepID=UPI0036464068